MPRRSNGAIRRDAARMTAPQVGLPRLAKLLFIAACCLSLAACVSLSPREAARAAAVVKAGQEQRVRCIDPAACALPSPYLALAESALTTSTPGAPQHYVNLLDQGEDALLIRVHLIRAAQHSIDLQTFIFAQDDAGHLVLDELVQAAARGVKVRVITDQLFSLDDTEFLARLARAHVNFELKVYNPTFGQARTQSLEFAAGILCCFFKFNQRMHNKLLLIDGRVGIAGGRNYENRYYDWDDDFDYRDRDMLVVGPATREMQASFEQFWQHPRAVSLVRLKDVGRRILGDDGTAAAYSPPEFSNAARVATLRQRASDIDYIQQHFVSATQHVGHVDYYSDSPNKPLENDIQARRELTARISRLLIVAQHDVVMETPYLVLSKTAQKIFRSLYRDHHVAVTVSTNSLAATDAFYVYALSYKYKKRYLKHLGFEIHEFKPFPADAENMIANYAELGTASGKRVPLQKYGRAPLQQQGVRIGLHAKTIVIDGAITLIGSHNFDPRSDNYNTEAVFIVRDAAFAAQVRTSILRNTEPQNAWVIAPRKAPPAVSEVSNAISDFSTALPLFDLWPFRYSTSFELNPDCAPLPPRDPNFYQCYKSVGDFPDVDVPLKSIYTRIVTAFGAGLVSIM